MKNKQIANIMFFSRGMSCPDLVSNLKNIDRFPCSQKQLELMENYDVPFTYMLDFNAIVDPRYREVLSKFPNCEIGVWFEVVRTLTDKAGIKYKGRDGYNWDFHCDASFSVGYPLEQRKLFVDLYMQEFKDAFGRYPKVFSAWVLDAYTLNYLYEKYHIEASCMCRDQWGTDGITLWSGYFGQGFYPCKNNILCPAQTKENQIDVPVFRMLGSCPIYQYDAGLKVDEGPADWMGVITLEPSYKDENTGGGGVPKWVDWFLKENYRKDTLGFNYAHIGQESTFGWNNQKDGTKYQIEKLIEMQNRGEVTLQTLLETAREFKECYALTPATAITALDDWKGTGAQSFWYETRNYRINCVRENGEFRIRDINLFREDYLERYRETVLDSNKMYFDNLPVIDGNRWSGNGVRAGIYPCIRAKDGQYTALKGETSVSFGENDETITVKDGDTVFSLYLTEEGIRITCNRDFKLEMKMSEKGEKPSVKGNSLHYRHEGFAYSLPVLSGICAEEDGNIVLRPEKGTMEISCIK